MSPRQTFAVYCKTRFDVRACNPTQAEVDQVFKAEAAEAAAIVAKWPGAIAKGGSVAAPRKDWAKVYAEAQAAGAKAGASVECVPMVINGGGKTYHVPDGVCGFAGIVVKDARSSFAKWLKANDLARNNYEGGKYIPVHEYGQSLTRKEAHATAMAEVLRAHGVDCRADSRID